MEGDATTISKKIIGILAIEVILLTIVYFIVFFIGYVAEDIRIMIIPVIISCILAVDFVFLLHTMKIEVETPCPSGMSGTERNY